MNGQTQLHSGTPLMVDYENASAISGGDVVVLAGIPHIAHTAFEADRGASLACRGGVYRAVAGPDLADNEEVYWNDINNVLTNLANGNSHFGRITPSGGNTTGKIVTAIHAPRGNTPNGTVQTVASAGSVQGDAASLTGGFNTVTGADGTKGVILPPAVAGGPPVYIYNAVATNGLKFYPATGDTLNGGSANAALTMEGKTLAVCYPVDATNWAVDFVANT